MTRHRLIRRPSAEVLDLAARRHPETQPTPSAGVRPWLPNGATRPVLTWCQGLAGGLELECCLQLEPTAHGVLAHLSATPQRHWPMPDRLSRLLVAAWSEQELAALARTAEAADAAA